MINWNDLRNFDVNDIDLSKIDVGRLGIRNLDLPTFDLPRLPDVDLPVEVDKFAGLARDAAYASVGAVVVSVRKADEARRELTDQVRMQVRRLVDAVA